MPKTFPTGFYMQPVSENIIWSISSAMADNHKIREWITNLESLNKSGLAKTDAGTRKKLYADIKSLFSADVAGGPMLFFRIYFRSEEFMPVDRTNKQFHSILKLFESLEYLF